MKIIIVGAGGQGRVVFDIIRAAGQHEVVGWVDASPARAGTKVEGLPVFGPVNVLPKLRQQKLAGAIVAIGDCRPRQRYAQVLHEQGFTLVNAIHPTAHISPTAKLGANVVIAPQAAICTDAIIGDSVILNTGCVIDHECQIDEAVHVCPGANLAGRVRVGQGAWIGIGSTTIQCIQIGEHATVGAGAVVIRDVPAHSTVVGIPARVIKQSEPPTGDVEIH